MVSGNTESGITVNIKMQMEHLIFNWDTKQDTTGSALNCIKTARTIGGVSFDGSANINLPA